MWLTTESKTCFTADEFLIDVALFSLLVDDLIFDFIVGCLWNDLLFVTSSLHL
jgi:hypothetical protein